MFEFDEGMQRAALVANGWIKTESGKWSRNPLLTPGDAPVELDRLLAFKTLLRDKNIG